MIDQPDAHGLWTLGLVFFSFGLWVHYIVSVVLSLKVPNMQGNHRGKGGRIRGHNKKVSL